MRPLTHIIPTFNPHGHNAQIEVVTSSSPHSRNTFVLSGLELNSLCPIKMDNRPIFPPMRERLAVVSVFSPVVDRDPIRI